MANDDHDDRMMAIDPATGALVRQYGPVSVHGTERGHLFKPDGYVKPGGFDILAPNGATPTRAATG